MPAMARSALSASATSANSPSGSAVRGLRELAGIGVDVIEASRLQGNSRDLSTNADRGDCNPGQVPLAPIVRSSTESHRTRSVDAPSGPSVPPQPLDSCESMSGRRESTDGEPQPQGDSGPTPRGYPREASMV